MSGVRALAVLCIALLAPAALAQQSDLEIRQAIVRDSRAAYHATGHPCACPDDLDRAGRRCGGRSAFSRPGGASPKCSVADVTAADIAAWRARR